MKILLNVWLYSLILSVSVQFEVVKIGAIFFQSELDLVLSFDTVVRQINELEREVRLEARKRFIRDDDSVVIQHLACELIENGVAAIFGPSSKTSSDIVEILCNITGIPHLQFDWHVQKTLSQRVHHQMTVNVAPSELVISMAFLDILRSPDFDWKSFTIAYESSTNLSRMQYLLAWKQLHKSGIKMHTFNRDDDYRVLWKRISTSREKFVLLDCPADILLDVVNTSKFFNMTGPFNHLLLTNLDTHLGHLDKLYARDFTVTTSAVRLRPFVPSPVQYEMDVFEEEEEDGIKSLMAQLIYDAVVLYFNALRNIVRALRYYEPTNLVCGRGFWKPGPEIVKEMKILTPRNVTPSYKTQKLQLNEHGERDDFNLEVYNPIIERISHVWNKQHQLVSFDKVNENSTKKTKMRLLEQKEDFSQRRVRYVVATKFGEPYFMRKDEPEGVHYEGNERFEGYAVDLIYKLAEECKFDFSFEPVQDNRYGSYDPVSDEWDGIIRQLIDNNAQIGICDLTITQARRSVVDFTVPFMQLGVSILYYKAPPPPANIFAFLKPYALEVWLYLVVALMITAFVSVLTARMSHPEWEPLPIRENETSEVENKWHLTNTFWLVIGSILNAGCDLLPRGPPMRLIISFWWIFALLLSQTYIAKLASFITASKMEGSIRNLHDLVDQNKVQFGTLRGGSTSLLFSESNETDYRLAWNKMIAMKPDAFTASNKEGVDRVKRSRGRYAFLMETTNLQYYVQRNCELTQVGEPFGEKHYGIAVPLHSPFRSNLSVGILKLSEKGVLYTLKNKWFNSNDTECTSESSQSKDGSTQFNLESVGGLFVVLIAGILLATLIAIFELLVHVENIVVREHVPFMLVLKSELYFFVRLWLSRKPLRTYDQSRGSTSTGYSSGDHTSSTVSVKKKKKSKKKITKCS